MNDMLRPLCTFSVVFGVSESDCRRTVRFITGRGLEMVTPRLLTPMLLSLLSLFLMLPLPMIFA